MTNNCPTCNIELKRVTDASYDWLKCPNCGYWIIVLPGESIDGGN